MLLYEGAGTDTDRFLLLRNAPKCRARTASGPAGATMYISRVELQNWKNFKRATAELCPRVFIIGPNAAGKSNLLDALRFLRDLAEKGLGAAVNLRGGVSPIRCLAARESPSVAIEVTLRSYDDANRWRYRIEFNQDASRTPIVRSERVVNLSSGQTLVDRPNEQDREDRLLLTQTSLEQIVANREFRDVSDFFASLSYRHLVPQVVRDPKGFSSAPVQNDPFGRDLLIRIWNTNARTRDAWLRRICTALRSAVPQLTSLEIEMDSQGIPHLVGRYEHWRAHEARQNETQWSDGTLRLFGLMWSMFEGAGPLLLEEPELSLHPEVVRSIPQMFVRLQDSIRRMKRKGDYEPRQVIISTHSEELLRDEGISADEVLIIRPGAEGSTIEGASESDRRSLEAGLTPADVLMPKASPTVGGQLMLSFDVV